MPTRTHAIGELTRLWLTARHGCLVDESVPVPMAYGVSEIDLVAVRPDAANFRLPDQTIVGPQLIVETRDEHDWEPTGREFGQALRSDVAQMNGLAYIPQAAKGVKFQMLRQQHYEGASRLFKTLEFDRLFVVHALDPAVRAELAPQLAAKRIYWLTVSELVDDLLGWYREQRRPTVLRNTLAGDMFHLLVGFCGYRPPQR